MRLEQIAAVITAKRETHPELSRELTWPGFVRICGREGVKLRRSPVAMPHMAQLVPFLGCWSILFSADAPKRRLLYLGAHELGHLWLHHDAQHDRWERVYNMETHWNEDPREDDAEMFASLILMGPARAKAVLPVTETRLQFSLRTVRQRHHRPR